MKSRIVMSAVQKAQDRFGPVFVEAIRVHAERHDENLNRLRKAVSCGQSRKIRTLQHLILHSYSAKIVCLVRSLTGKRSAKWVQATASQLDAWIDPNEPVLARKVPKSSGDGWRPIVEFGPKRKALQMLCRDVIEARHGSDVINYLSKGKGADRASDYLVKLMKGTTYRYFVVADIENFFRSVRQKSIQETTGLPEAVILNCILMNPNVLISPTPTTDAFDGAVRQGLPQGSRASNLVASLLLGPALRSITSADRIVTYGDDIVIAACNKVEAKALQTALSGMFASHPAGPFCLKRCEILHVNEGFDFLKYKHAIEEETGNVWLRPSGKSYYRFSENVILLALTTSRWSGLKKVARYSARWMAAFPRWRWNWHSKYLLGMTAREAICRGWSLKKS